MTNCMDTPTNEKYEVSREELSTITPGCQVECFSDLLQVGDVNGFLTIYLFAFKRQSLISMT